MKISKELEGKIKRSVNAKYADETKSLNDEIEKIKDEEISKAVLEVTEAIKTYPSVKRYLEYNRGYSEKSILETVRGNSYKFINEKSYAHIEKKLDAIKAKKALEVENLMITISYEKDIDGIKKEFSDMGFEF